MKKIYETAVILLGTIGWWGFVYPELCLTEDVYEQEYEDDKVEEETENEMSENSEEETQSSGIWERIWDDGYRSGWQMGEIRIKSRLAEYVYQVKEK